MNTTLDSLTESIVENGKTILAATLIVKGPADRPHRVVMRYWRGEFVTHLELLKPTAARFLVQPGTDAYEAFEHEGYEQGHYHGQDFDEAMRDFNARASVLLRRLTRKAA